MEGVRFVICQKMPEQFFTTRRVNESPRLTIDPGGAPTFAIPYVIRSEVLDRRTGFETNHGSPAGRLSVFGSVEWIGNT